MTFAKPQRRVSKVFIHCSASDDLDHDNVETIRSWHLARGFSDIGYHFVVSFEGDILVGRDIELSPATQKGHNTGSIAICVAGLRNFTIEQMQAVIDLCMEIDNALDVTFHGHCEVSRLKSCPVFDYRSVLGLTHEGHMRRA